MTLTKKDLQSIKSLVDDSIEQNNEIISDKIIFEVKSIVDFATEKSEMKLGEKIDKVADDLADFRKEMNREISDIAETQHEFLKKFGDHEVRIKKLELKTGTLKS
ncbi:MAG: hypothetical protein Q7S80_00555 [bacterium]|nr:hypothetical protein [bacterium]